jgi:hypothetical protein
VRTDFGGVCLGEENLGDTSAYDFNPNTWTGTSIRPDDPLSRSAD